MKKVLITLGLALTLVTNVFADNTIDQLNNQVVTILAPFQNQETIAQLTFGAVETNDERAVKVEFNGHYRKVGSQNMLDVKVDNFSYNYGDGISPTSILRGSINIDITKIFSQDEINAIFTNGAEMIESLAKEYSKEYGDAASVKGVVTSATKDSDGNFTGITALISGRIDLSKLPENMESEDVFATNAVISLSLNTKTGFSIDGYVVSNPEYRGFQRDEAGLKEYLDKLLAGDEEAIAFISMFFSYLDEMASNLVNE